MLQVKIRKSFIKIGKQCVVSVTRENVFIYIRLIMVPLRFSKR